MKTNYREYRKGKKGKKKKPINREDLDEKIKEYTSRGGIITKLPPLYEMISDMP